MTDTPVISTNQLRKSFGRTEAVRGLTFSVKSQQITAFLGANGAGKGTTIKMLLGMLKPSGGEAKVLGIRIDGSVESVDVRKRIAYVSEDKRLYGYMTVEQVVRFTSSYFPDWQNDIANALIKRYRLPLNRKVKALSKGTRTKLALLLAFARRPELLILDEPSEGLDPHGVEDLLENLVSHAAQGTAIFFSTHQISEVERIADHVCILSRGEMVLDAPVDELRESYRQINLTFSNAPAGKNIHLEGVERVQIRGNQMAVIASRNADAIVEHARQLHAISIEVVPLGLREIYLQTARAD